MSKLKKEELLGWFDGLITGTTTPHPERAHDEQAYQQIKELIESASNDEDWDKARDAYGGYREDE